MIKVCHMTSAHPSCDIRIFHKECISLAKAGYEVYLVQRGESCEKTGVHIVGVGQPSGGRISRMTTFAKRVYQAALLVDADIYHIHDPELLGYGLKLKKKGKKIIFDSHELYRLQIAAKPYLPKWCAKWISRCYVYYEDYVLKRIDGVIFPCTINGKNPFEGKCTYTALIDNTPLLQELYNIWKDQKKEKVACCYVGGIRPDRGITQDVVACNRVNIPLILAGNYSSTEYKESLYALDHQHCIDWRGCLDRVGVREVLLESSIGLVTELYCGQNNTTDNLPTKTYEYMSCALPVIISHSTYVDRVMKERNFGICVDPNDADEIASAVRYLLDHPEEARQMGENGRRAIKEEFNWGVEEKKLLTFYEKISSEMIEERK